MVPKLKLPRTSRPVVVVMMAVFIVLLCARLASAQEAVPAAISFGQVVLDDQIEAVLQKHNARPYAVYMSAGEMTGVHRVPYDTAALTVLHDARAHTAAVARESLRSTTQSLQAFVNQLDRQTFVASSPEMVEKGRSRLRQNQHSYTLAEASEHNKPLVYAVEVLVSASAVPALAREPLVERVSMGAVFLGRPIVDRPEPPSKRGYRPLETLTPSEIYDELRRAATRARQEVKLDQ